MNKIKSKPTIEREKVLEMAKDIIAGRTRKLIDTQSILAMGCIRIYKMVTHYEGKKKVKGKPKLVTNDREIVAVLDHEFGEGDDPSDDKEYFFIETKEPDNTAIESQLNRTYGKATQTQEIKIKEFIVDSETKTMSNLALGGLLNNETKNS